MMTIPFEPERMDSGFEEWEGRGKDKVDGMGAVMEHGRWTDAANMGVWMGWLDGRAGGRADGSTAPFAVAQSICTFLVWGDPSIFAEMVHKSCMICCD